MVLAQQPIMIIAGGTGGHVFPALAVAQALRAQQLAVVWMGTRQGLEARVVPQAGIPIEWIKVHGIRGKGVVAMLCAPLNLIRACWQAMRVIRRVQPRLILGMGGFVAGPGGLMARLLGKPLIIHEQNAVPGTTNRILAHIADAVLEAFPNTFRETLAPLCTGNPLRSTITLLPSPEQRLAGRSGPLRLLVLGGSLGASVLNATVPAAIKSVPLALRPQIRHQSGQRDCEAVTAAYLQQQIVAEVSAFIDDMAAAYAWADLVICRSGAMTVAELAAVGLAAILIPFPYAIDDHQSTNARQLAARDAAIVLPQPQLTAEKLGDCISALSVDRQRLLVMAKHARSLARPDATQAVVNQCLLLAGEFDYVR